MGRGYWILTAVVFASGLVIAVSYFAHKVLQMNSLAKVSERTSTLSPRIYEGVSESFRTSRL